MPVIYTIGHSNHPAPAFLGLLQAHGVEFLADIRSRPASRFAPQFSRAALEAALAEAGIAYRWFGEGLGGRPRDPALYGPDGHPDYAKMATSPAFAAALDDLFEAASRARIAIMCAERDPQKCHRNQLVTPVLLAHGATVQHILADGTLICAASQPESAQGDLFG